MSRRGSRSQVRSSTAQSSPARPRAFFPPLLIVGAAAYAFHGSLAAGFVFDDATGILENASIRHIGTAFFPPSDTPLTGRPIANLSLALNYAAGGLSPWGYHAVAILIHILAALLLYGVVRRALLRAPALRATALRANAQRATALSPALRARFGEEAEWLAGAVALIWTVHPLQTESVTYATQRTELLAGLFLLLTLYCVQRGAESARAGVWYAGAVLSCALGMGSKEVMVVAPLVVLAYDRLLLAPSFQEIVRARGRLYAGLAATWLIFAALAPARMHVDLAAINTTAITPWDYFKTQGSVIVHYLRLAVWPAPLVGDYSDWPVATSIVSALPWGAIVLALLAATVWAIHRQLPAAFLGVWFFLILAPTSSVWPIPLEVAAERRMYLPLAAVIALVVLGAFVALGEGTPRDRGTLRGRRLLEGAVLAMIVIALAQTSVARSRVYASDESFWSDVVAKRPTNARAHIALGDNMLQGGRLDDAFAQASRAVQLAPAYPPAHEALADILAQQGRLDEAEAQYREAVRLNPRAVQAYHSLGVLLAALGKNADAIAAFTETVRLDPLDALAHTNLAVLLAGQGKRDESIAHFSTAASITRTASTEYNLGWALVQAGRLDEGKPHLQAALTLDPNFAPAKEALQTLTSPPATR